MARLSLSKTLAANWPPEQNEEKPKDALPPLPPFSDLAGIARKFREAYRQNGSNPCDSEASDPPECFHTNSAFTLALLQRSAYGEVRGKVMLTAGVLLPAELTDEIVEYALVAEGLPAELQEYRSKHILRHYELEQPCEVIKENRKWRRHY